MLKPFSRLLCIIITYCILTLPALAQVNGINDGIAEARQLVKSNRCDAAIIKLEGISGELKDSPDYLLTMAQAHDCKDHLEEAISYYKRYLQQQTNDSVQKRYVALTATKRSKENSVVINEAYKSASGIKNKKKPGSIGNGHIVAFTASYQFPVVLSPYSVSNQFGIDVGFPIMRKKVTAIFTAAATYYSLSRDRWIKKMAGSSDASGDFDESWGLDLFATVPYWIKNNGNTAWGVAAMAGYRKVAMKDPVAAVPGVGYVPIVLPNISGPMFGFGGVFATRLQVIYLGYNWYNVDGPAPAAGAQRTSFNMSTITLKVNYGRWRR